MRTFILVLSLSYSALAAGPREVAPLKEEPLALVPVVPEKSLEKDFGTVVAGSRNELKWVLRHGGEKSFQVQSFTIEPPFVLKSGGCTGVWQPGRTCELSLAFEPKNPGAHAGTLKIELKGDYEEREVGFRVTGLATRPARIELDGETAFGGLPLGRSATRMMTIRNTGETEARDVGVSADGRGFSASGCARPLPPGASCPLSIQFQASAPGGVTGTLKVTYQNGVGSTSAERALSGAGLRPASLSLSVPAGGDFGRRILGTTTDFLVSVSNTGDLSAEGIAVTNGWNAPFGFRGGKYPGTGGDCGVELSARTTCRLGVQVSPLFAGISEQAFGLKYRDGLAGRMVSKQVRAEGITPATLSVRERAPAEFSQRIYTSNVEERYHVVNKGQHEATALRFTGQEFKGVFQLAPAQGGKIAPCGSALAPGGECEFAVRFSSRKAGRFDASVLFHYFNGAQDQQVNFPITAKALTPAKIVVEHKGPLEFGEIVTELTKAEFVSIVNEGEVPAERLETSTLRPPFTFKWEKQKGGDQDICGQAVHGGRRCLFQILFSPTQPGLVRQEVKFSYGDGLEARAIGLPLGGKGLKPAKMELVGETPVDFGMALVTGVVEKTLKFRNTGDVPATTLKMEVSEKKRAAWPKQESTCPPTLVPGKDCTVKLTFAPPKKGDHEGKLELKYGDGRGPVAQIGIALKGLGKPTAKLVFDGKDKIELPRTLVGLSGDRIVVVKNEGEHPAVKLTGMVGEGKGPFAWKGKKFPGDGGDCKDKLEAGGSCRLALAFTPETAGRATAGVELTYDDGAKPGRLAGLLDAQGVTPGRLELSRDDLDFGIRVTGSKARLTFEVKNLGGDEVDFFTDKIALSRPLLFRGGSFPGDGGSCGSRLGAGKSCRIEVEFAPEKDKVVDEKLKILFTDKVAKEQKAELVVKAEARAPAKLSFKPELVPDFGKRFVGDVKEERIRIQNEGRTDAELKLKSTREGTFALSHDCPTKLAGGAKCEAVVKFVPEKPKSYDGLIQVRYDDGIEKQERELAVKGEGQTPAEVRASRTRLEFGSRRVGEHQTRTLSLENRGTVDATSMEASSPLAPFRWEGGRYPGRGGDCGKRLSAGSSCKLELAFEPVTGGGFDGAVEIRYQDGKTRQTVPLELAGWGEELSPQQPRRDVTSESDPGGRRSRIPQ